MQTKHLCVLIHIRTKGEVGTAKLVWGLQEKYFFTDRSKAVLLLWIILLFMFRVCQGFSSVHCSLVVTCWERANLLALVFCDVSLCFVTFPYGVLGQV